MGGIILGILLAVMCASAVEDPVVRAYYHLLRAKQAIQVSGANIDKDMFVRMLDSLIYSLRKEIPDPKSIRNSILLREDINRDFLSYDRLRHLVEPFGELGVVAPKVMDCGEAREKAKRLADEIKKPTYVVRFEGLCRVVIGGFRKFEEAVRYGKAYFSSFNLYVVR